MSTLQPQSILPEVLGSIQHLTPEKFEWRARRIRLVLTDNDGVLTDTGVYYGADGEAVKRYSIRDGMGM
jgi:3-deoxy-D-manno-octulosonate 8-phosphate phosphatase (KDO 8-P phosphatase)